MNRILSWSLSTLLFTTPVASAQDAPPTLEKSPFLTSPGEQWKLLWHDEFDGASLDASKWSIGLPWGGTDGTGRQHSTKYASYIVDHNHVFEGGRLKLLTRREDVVDKKGKTFHFTQGMTTTSGKFEHKYGYWEVRAKLPTEAGPGLWPAFWTLSKGWPPEMDVLEVWTSLSRTHQGLCYRDAAGKVAWDDYNAHYPLPTDWTTYGMEWGPGYQVYNINGEVKRRVYGDRVTDVDHYILLNSGVDAIDPPTAATVFPNTFDVEYVRVYERPDVPAFHNGTFEDEDRRPWSDWGQVALVGYGAHEGKQALRVDGGPSTSEQKVYGLTPNTTYVVRGWVKTLGDATEARLGVKGHGGEEKYASVSATGYTEAKVEFTTGSGVTTAMIYCFVPTKTGVAFFDDVTITRK